MPAGIRIAPSGRARSRARRRRAGGVRLQDGLVGQLDESGEVAVVAELRRGGGRAAGAPGRRCSAAALQATVDGARRAGGRPRPRSRARGLTRVRSESLAETAAGDGRRRRRTCSVSARAWRARRRPRRRRAPWEPSAVEARGGTGALELLRDRQSGPGRRRRRRGRRRGGCGRGRRAPGCGAPELRSRGWRWGAECVGTDGAGLPDPRPGPTWGAGRSCRRRTTVHVARRRPGRGRALLEPHRVASRARRGAFSPARDARVARPARRRVGAASPGRLLAGLLAAAGPARLGREPPSRRSGRSRRRRRRRDAGGRSDERAVAVAGGGGVGHVRSVVAGRAQGRLSVESQVQVKERLDVDLTFSRGAPDVAGAAHP